MRIAACFPSLFVSFLTLTFLLRFITLLFQMHTDRHLLLLSPPALLSLVFVFEIEIDFYHFRLLPRHFDLLCRCFSATDHYWCSGYDKWIGRHWLLLLRLWLLAVEILDKIWLWIRVDDVGIKG